MDLDFKKFGLDFEIWIWILRVSLDFTGFAWISRSGSAYQEFVFGFHNVFVRITRNATGAHRPSQACKLLLGMMSGSHTSLDNRPWQRTPLPPDRVAGVLAHLAMQSIGGGGAPPVKWTRRFLHQRAHKATVTTCPDVVSPTNCQCSARLLGRSACSLPLLGLCLLGLNLTSIVFTCENCFLSPWHQPESGMLTWKRGEEATRTMANSGFGSTTPVQPPWHRAKSETVAGSTTSLVEVAFTGIWI